jgi:hypothetical protein
MRFIPLEDNDRSLFQNLKLIATDMDGTLTQRGKFSPALIQAFENLAEANIQVLIVTGRSAGWVSGLVNYLPIAGAIAENGGLFYQAGNEEAIVLMMKVCLTLNIFPFLSELLTHLSMQTS